MKKLFFVALTLTIMIASLSCESKGPVGKVNVPEFNSDEIVEDVLDGDGWVYKWDVELHYKQNGEWISAGMYNIYSNTYDNDDDCSFWVDFSGFKSPAKKCSNYGYSYKVQYQGVWFYF